MYGLYGLTTNIQNIFKLSEPYLRGRKVEVVAGLKPSYLEFLADFQKNAPIHRGADLVVRDSEVAKALIAGFAGSKINDLEQESMIGGFCSDDELALRAEVVNQHLNALNEVNPEVYELFQLAVQGILLAWSGSNAQGFKAHGGTSNSCIGTIWLNLRPGLSTQDILEMLIHELTHTLVFLDELNEGHFDYVELVRKETFARSSILKRDRPMDKVVHSIVVSTEILMARERYLPNVEPLHIHPESKALKESTRLAIESVLKHKDLSRICQTRAIELVLAARTAIDHL